MSTTDKSGGVPASEILDVGDLVQYGDGAIVSRTLVKGPAGTITIFAFDEGQGLSEHTAPFDAFVQIVAGAGELTIGGKRSTVRAGQAVLMPAGVPHAVHAVGRMTMLLTMLRA